MITMTVNELITLVPILKELMTNSFNGSLAFKISRLIRELDKELELFDSHRKKIIDKYGKKESTGRFMIEKGQVVILEPEKCNAELEELLNTRIEIFAEKIPVSCFDSIVITPTQALSLELIVE